MRILGCGNHDQEKDECLAYMQVVHEIKSVMSPITPYNTVCVSYPQPRWFYELCDEIGMYVIDQANINSDYRKDDRNVGGAVANDPRFLPNFLDRVACMQGRMKNNTSLIAISMGEKVAMGIIFYKAYQWLKAHDTLHPVTYRDVQGEWNSDFNCPAPEDVRRFCKKIRLSEKVREDVADEYRVDCHREDRLFPN